jgi:hypothetical protein
VRGGWGTVAIAFEQRRGEAEQDWVKKVTLLRMKRVGGLWRKHAAITLGGDEATELAGQLVIWLG